MIKQLLYRFIYSNKVNFLLRNLNKALYPVLPSKLMIPPSGSISFTLENQKLIFHTNQTSYLTQLIFWNGFRNFEYSDIFIQLIKKLDDFYDVGANIGYYSLIAASVNPGINVTSFEPASGPLFYLLKNVEANNLKNIRIESLALSHKEGEIDFYEVKSKKYKFLKNCLSGEGNIAANEIHKDYHINVVKSVTLDNYVKLNQVKNIDLIKIDTEGTEDLILKEATKVIENMTPIIICETLFNTIEGKLEKIMLRYNYRFFNHTPDGLVEVKTIQRKVDDNVRNCFFVPSSKIELVEEFVA